MTPIPVVLFKCCGLPAAVQTEVYFKNWLFYCRVRCQHFTRAWTSHNRVFGTAGGISSSDTPGKGPFKKRVSLKLAASSRRLMGHFLLGFIYEIFNMG